MKKIQRFVIWICSKFTRSEIEEIIQGLADVLANRDPAVKPKDDFKEKHPNYRNFFVDPEPPLTSPPKPKPKLNYKKLLVEYEKQNGFPLKPVKLRKSKTKVPRGSICKKCLAPAQYLYFNNGKKRTQLKCKVCADVSLLHPKHRNKSKYFCPHCNYALFLWKQRKDVSIYKCPNRKCPLLLKNKAKLNFREKIVAKIKPSQFKLKYLFREFHFTNEQLIHSSPEEKHPSIFNIRNSLNTLSLILTFHVSLAISARKTAYILKNVFSIPCSHKTVLNYAQAAAYHCQKFNFKYKGDIDDTQAADETYLKIKGKQNYAFLAISALSRKITAYHIDNSRDTLPAIIAMNEAVRTAKPDQNITIVSDGNPSYPAGIHFINQSRSRNLSHKKVIGIQNLDSESEKYRPFKQLIERLNRTYKFHIRTAAGFNNKNGAVSLTTLFVTHYNFIRPHSSLNYAVPIPLDELKNIDTIQGKWAKILHMAFNI